MNIATFHGKKRSNYDSGTKSRDDSIALKACTSFDPSLDKKKRKYSTIPNIEIIEKNTQIFLRNDAGFHSYWPDSEFSAGITVI